MKISMNKYDEKITYILSELDTIQTGDFFEINSNPANPSAQTIARNIKKEFTELLKTIENDTN